MALTTKIGISIAAEYTKAFDLTTGKVNLNKIYQAVLASGIAVGQSDLIFHDQRTLAASTSEDLDLVGTMLQDAYGANLALVKVKGLIIAAKGVTDANGVVITPNTNNVIVGAAASNAWAALLNSTGTITLRPGAAFSVVAGDTDNTAYAVTAGTGDLLKVANSAGGSSITYDIIVVGTSA